MSINEVVIIEREASSKNICSASRLTCLGLYHLCINYFIIFFSNKV